MDAVRHQPARRSKLLSPNGKARPQLPAAAADARKVALLEFQRVKTTYRTAAPAGPSVAAATLLAPPRSPVQSPASRVAPPPPPPLQPLPGHGDENVAPWGGPASKVARDATGPGVGSAKPPVQSRKRVGVAGGASGAGRSGGGAAALDIGGGCSAFAPAESKRNSGSFNGYTATQITQAASGAAASYERGELAHKTARLAVVEAELRALHASVLENGRDAAAKDALVSQKEEAIRALTRDLARTRETTVTMEAALNQRGDELRAARAALERAAGDLTASEARERVGAAAAADAAADAEATIAELREGLEAQGTRAAAAEAGLAEASARAAHLEAKFADVDAERSALQEEVLTLKGSIRVVCRVRPATPAEAAAVLAATPMTVDGDDSDDDGAPLASGARFCFPSGTADGRVVEIVEGERRAVDGRLVEGRAWPFEFNRVLDPLATQEVVFAEVRGLLQYVVDGHRVCVFAYGQTGAGKTFTMEGLAGQLKATSCVTSDADAAKGLIPRSVEHIFRRLEQLREGGWTVALTADMIEIYNDEIRDLLSGADHGDVDHKIRHVGDKVTTVSNVTLHAVQSPREVYELLQQASRNRATAKTHCNAQSSRSHSVFTLTMTAKHPGTGLERRGVLNMVDLAGSERMKKSGAASDPIRLKETQHINRSLSALGAVIAAIASKKPHVPFRDSTLTHLLQNSLSGDSRTLMLCNLSPNPGHFGESLNSLRFAKTVSSATTNAAGRAAAPP